MSQPAVFDERPDLSLVLGGPLFQLFRRPPFPEMPWWVLVVEGAAWVPLLLLSAFGGHARGGTIGIPFLQAGWIPGQILHAGQSLIAFKLEMAGSWLWSSASCSSRSPCSRRASPARNVKGCVVSAGWPAGISRSSRIDGTRTARRRRSRFWGAAEVE